MNVVDLAIERSEKAGVAGTDFHIVPRTRIRPHFLRFVVLSYLVRLPLFCCCRRSKLFQDIILSWISFCQVFCNFEMKK
jgi:hypothetical protein